MYNFAPFFPYAPHFNPNFVSPMSYDTYAQQQMIIDEKKGDVTGDQIVDTVYLTGRKMDPNSPFVENLTLVIRDGRTNFTSSFPLAFDSGVNPSLFLGDFTNDKINDIFISIPTGGSGGFVYHYLYSFSNNRLAPLFDPEEINKGIPFDAKYRKNYTVVLNNKDLDKKFFIDVRQKKDIYENQVYDQKGNVITQSDPSVGSLVGLYPILFDGDDAFSLMSRQRIVGIANADTIGNVQAFWKYSPGQRRMKFTRAEVAI